MRRLLTTGNGPCGAGGEPLRRPQVDQRLAPGTCARARARSADDDVRVPVGVDVARARHRGTEPRSLVSAVGVPRGNRVEATLRTVEDECPTRVDSARIETGRANDHVVVPVAVDVAGERHGAAHLGVRLTAGNGPERSGAQRVGRAVEHAGSAVVDAPAVDERRSDDDVGVAVAVDVACRGNAPPQVSILVVAFG